MYKHIAQSYNELYGEEQLKKLKIIKKYLKIKEPLFDVGCGTGISTNYFKVKSFGIDNCKEMLIEGRKNYKNLIYASAEKLPFKDKSFNTIISVTSFHNFKNMEKALKEIKRVSKNNNIAITFLKKSIKIEKFRNLLKKHFKFKEIDCYNDILFLIS
jgi:ubiquinone/menaquinone biosynthesis C-methylase UbiE